MDEPHIGREREPRHQKPLLTAEQQVAHLKEMGVTFRMVGEEEAVAYLRDANNYLRVASYRKLYPRRVEGSRAGSYANLDFGALVALASLDRRLREALLMASVDVEHFAKMRVLREAERRGEDGYAIVSDFLASLTHAERNRLVGGLRMRAREGDRRDTYLGDLIGHYLADMPVWVLLEAVEFGAFANFYLFCAGRWADATMRQEHYVLKSVKALRNACAHNTCIVNGFVSRSGEGVADFPTSPLIASSLKKAGVRNSKSRRARLRNLRMAQIAATLFSLRAFCPRSKTTARHAERLAAVRSYAERNAETFAGNNALVSSLDFLWRLVDVWAPHGAYCDQM